MRVFVTGGTGLIGGRLVGRLRDRGDVPLVLTRRPEAAARVASLAGAELVAGDPTQPGDWQERIGSCQAVVNLAGEPVFGRRWDAAVKRAIRESRLRSAANVVAAIERAGTRPGVLVNASAIGYYGPRADEILDEDSAPGAGFMAETCQEWEAAARAVEPAGARLAIVRIGIVLARGAGALGVMEPLFRYGPGAPIGSAHPLLPARGRQWMSWIHVDDMVEVLLRALDDPAARGPINATAPEPSRNADFTRALSAALRTPLTPWRFALPIGPPDFLLRIALGEVAQVVTQGQRVVPSRLLALGHRFRYPTLAGALANLYERPAAGRTG